MVNDLLLRQKFDFITQFYSNLLSSCSLQFNDKKLDEAFLQVKFSQSKIGLKIISGVMLVLSVLIFILLKEVSLFNLGTNLVAFIVIYSILVAGFAGILISSFFVKYHGKFFVSLQIFLFLLLYLLYLSSIITLLTNDVSGNTCYISLRIYSLIITIYFCSNFFFPFSITRMVVLNLFTIGLIIGIYVSNGDSFVYNDIIFLVASVICFEVFGYLKDKSEKNLFVEKLQTELLMNYFIEILTQMNVGLGIIKGQQVIFSNEMFGNCFNKMECQEILRMVQIEKMSETKPNEKESISIGLLKKNQTPTVKFNKSGIRCINSRIFDMNMSHHSVNNYDIREIIVYDVTDSIEKEQMKREFTLKSNLIAKISHEFTTPIIALKESAKGCLNTLAVLTKSEDKLGKDMQLSPLFLRKDSSREASPLIKSSSLGQVRTVMSNLKKIKYISEYFFLLIKELSFYVSTSFDLPGQKSSIDVIKLIRKCIKIITCVKEMNDMKSKSMHFSLLVDINGNITSHANQAAVGKLVTSLDHEKFYQFLINIFIILMKIVYKGETTVKVIYHDKLNPHRAKIEITCNTSFKLHESLEPKITQSQNYSTLQGIDISADMCRRFSNELGLGLEFNYIGDNCLIVHFEFDAEYQSQSEYAMIRKSSSAQTLKVKCNTLLHSFPRKISNNQSSLNIKSPGNVKTFIIADDVVDIRNSLRNILQSIYRSRKEEISIIQCTDGIDILSEVYKHFKSSKSCHTISCIITDQFMNFMNGSEAAKIIKGFVENKKIPYIPVLFATAFQDAISLSAILDVKPSLILRKPLTREMVENALAECHVI